jgi:molybdate transport system substrate-binding protein
MSARTLGSIVIATGLMLAGAGCGSSSEPAAAASGASTSGSVGATTPAVTGTVTVLAAASLTGTFTQIGKDFEAAHPGVRVTFSFGGSSTLAAQIDQGAPADVFASAGPTNMKQVSDAGGVDGTATTFVKNQLVIAVAKGNPLHIAALADLAKPGAKVVECAAAVPCGAAATKALAAGNVKIIPVSLETDVKSALSKVTLGEADAALVYRTDALSVPDKVDGVEFPESAQAINEYPIAALTHAANPSGAKAFVAFVESAPEITVLTDAGFQKP